jgi:N-acetylneuraminate synthase
MTRTLIIAEAGVNHDGDLDKARALVAVAAAAGADLVKFQTFVADRCISRFAPKAEYQIANTGEDTGQLEMVRKLELSRADHEALIAECRRHGIAFFSTGFDPESIDLLVELGLDRLKIPSGEITNLPLLRHYASKRLPIILSTGMASIGEVEAAVEVLVAGGVPCRDITILHCNTEYPTPIGDVNLRAMPVLGAALGLPFGYSDHTAGIEVAIAAVALGACVIEKHFTLDRTMPGPDHRASLEPDELRHMVAAIRNVEQALAGDGVKRPSSSEFKNRAVARRSLVAAGPIAAGETFTAENLTSKRPGTGISPMRWDEVIGQAAPRDFVADEVIAL